MIQPRNGAEGDFFDNSPLIVNIPGDFLVQRNQPRVNELVGPRWLSKKRQRSECGDQDDKENANNQAKPRSDAQIFRWEAGCPILSAVRRILAARRWRET